MKKSRFCWCTAALVLATSALNVSAHAAISSISAGASANVPLGTNNQILNQPAGVELQADMPISLFGSNPHLLKFSGVYQPYKVKNMGNGTLNLFGVYAGLSTATEDTPHFLNPFISADIGAVYEYLSLSGVSNSIQNTAMGFSLRAVPGLDVPVVGNLGIRLEMPVTATWFKTSFYTWATLFSIRWKL